MDMVTLQQLSDRIGIPLEELLRDTGLDKKEVTGISTVTETMLRHMIAEKQKNMTGNNGVHSPMAVPMQNVEKPDEELTTLMRENCILVDTSVLLSPGWDLFLERILPLLVPGQKRLYLPVSVLEELQTQTGDTAKGTDNRGDDVKTTLYRRRLERLSALHREKLVSVRGRQLGINSTSAEELLTICAALKMATPLLILTQNERLAADLLMLNRQPSAVGKTVTVRGIDGHGNVGILLSKKTVIPASVKNKLKIAANVTSEPDMLLPGTDVPVTGDTLTTAVTGGKTLVLTEEIGRGTEGVLYRTDSGETAKIYHANCRTVRRMRKVALLVEAELSFAGICFPKVMLYNNQGAFVGFLMDMAAGQSMASCIFQKTGFTETFGDWDREKLAQLAVTVVDKIRYLHSRNVLVGGFDPAHFLVVSPTEVYVVDVDSMQVNDLPSPTGYPLYTAPERQKQRKDMDAHDFSETLRTLSDDCYALGILVFQLLMMGQVPCMLPAKNSSPLELFQTPVSMMEWDKPAAETDTRWGWRCIWSHLPQRPKKIFRKMFTKSAAGEPKSQNSSEWLTPEQWHEELQAYLTTTRLWKKELELFCQKHTCTVEDIEQNRVDGCQADPQGLAIFPNRFKRNFNVKYRFCSHCGKEVAMDTLVNTLCPACVKSIQQHPPVQPPKQSAAPSTEKQAVEPVQVPSVPKEAKPVADPVVQPKTEPKVQSKTEGKTQPKPNGDGKRAPKTGVVQPSAAKKEPVQAASLPKKKKSKWQQMKSRIKAAWDGMYEI